MTVDWSEALDRLEEGLRGCRCAIDDPEAPPTPAFEPPSVAGPPPADLQDRVRGLVRELEELATLVEERKGAVSDELRRLPRRPDRAAGGGTGESRFELRA